MTETNENLNSTTNGHNGDIIEEIKKLLEKIKDQDIRASYLNEIEKVFNQKLNNENQIRENTRKELEYLREKIQIKIFSDKVNEDHQKFTNFFEENPEILKGGLFIDDKKIYDDYKNGVIARLSIIGFDNFEKIFSLKDKPEEMVKKINELNNEYNEKNITPRLFTDLKETFTEIFPFVQENIKKVEMRKIGINEENIEKINSKLGNKKRNQLNIQLFLFEKLNDSQLKQELQIIGKDIIENPDNKEKHQKNIHEFLTKLESTKLLYQQKIIMYSIIFNLSNIFNYTEEAEKISKNKENFEKDIEKEYSSIEENYLKKIYGEDYITKNLTGGSTDIFKKSNVVDTYIQYKTTEGKKEGKSDIGRKENKYLKDMGIPINENGEIDMKKGEKIKIGENKTATLELTDTGEFFITNQLGYNFKYTNINYNKEESPKISQDEMNNFYEITHQMNILDRVGFGYFGEDFKLMIDTIVENSSLINSATGISIKESIGYDNDFLGDTERALIFDIFYKLGFLPNNSSYYTSSLYPEVMTKNNFLTNISKIEQNNTNGKAFYTINGGFNREGMIEALKNLKTQKNETN